MLIVPGSNMIYFTGLHYSLSERPIIAILTADGLSFIVPKLEVHELVKRPDLEARAFPWTDEDGYMGAFEKAIDDLGLRGKTLGIDGMTMRVSEWLALPADRSDAQGQAAGTRTDPHPRAQAARRNRGDAPGDCHQREGAGAVARAKCSRA